MASTVAYESGPPSAGTIGLAARVRRFVRFGLVGLSGVLVNEAALALLVDVAHTNYLLGAVLATQCSTVWNFALVEWWAFDDAAADGSGRLRRFAMFWAVNMAALALRGPILALLTSVFHIHYLISNLISLGVLVVLRFAIADSLIWGGTPRATPTGPVSRDDLLAHFPHNLGEDLGWALNPVAEAAELVGDAPAASVAMAPPAVPPVPTVDAEAIAPVHAEPAAPVEPTVPTAAPVAPALPPDLLGGPPRFGTVRPRTPPG